MPQRHGSTISVITPVNNTVTTQSPNRQYLAAIAARVFALQRICFGKKLQILSVTTHHSFIIVMGGDDAFNLGLKSVLTSGEMKRRIQRIDYLEFTQESRLNLITLSSRVLLTVLPYFVQTLLTDAPSFHVQIIIKIEIIFHESFLPILDVFQPRSLITFAISNGSLVKVITEGFSAS